MVWQCPGQTLGSLGEHIGSPMEPAAVQAMAHESRVIFHVRNGKVYPARPRQQRGACNSLLGRCCSCGVLLVLAPSAVPTCAEDPAGGQLDVEDVDADVREQWAAQDEVLQTAFEHWGWTHPAPRSYSDRAVLGDVASDGTSD